MSSIEDRVKAVLAERKCCAVEELLMSEKIGKDSLEKLDILVALETEFNVSVPDKEAQQLETCEDILEYIERSKTQC